MSEKITGNNENYPDLIANISLRVPDDLCIIQSTGKQKLLDLGLTEEEVKALIGV